MASRRPGFAAGPRPGKPAAADSAEVVRADSDGPVGCDRADSNATGVNGDQSDNSAEDAGAAYVFTRTGTTWSQQAYLKASNTEGDDGFGESMALAGDTLVVAAPFEDSNTTFINGNQADNSAGASGAICVIR